MGELTHFDEHGASRMVDVSGKEVDAPDGAGQRLVRMEPATSGLVATGGWPRGTSSRSPGWRGSWRRSGPAS